MCDVSWGVGGRSPEKRTYDGVSRGHNRYVRLPLTRKCCAIEFLRSLSLEMCPLIYI